MVESETIKNSLETLLTNLSARDFQSTDYNAKGGKKACLIRGILFAHASVCVNFFKPVLSNRNRMQTTHVLVNFLLATFKK